jgi:hypothetical protein
VRSTLSLTLTTPSLANTNSSSLSSGYIRDCPRPFPPCAPYHSALTTLERDFDVVAEEEEMALDFVDRPLSRGESG